MQTDSEPRSPLSAKIGTLTFAQLYGLFLSAMAVGVTFLTQPVMTLSGAGNGAWLAMILAGCTAAMIGSSINVFAKRYRVSGGVMSYIGEAFGRTPRTIIGVTMNLGYLIYLALVIIIVAFVFQGFFQNLGMSWFSTVSGQITVYVGVSILGGVIAVQGAAVAGRIGLWVGMLMIPFIILLLTGLIINGNTSVGPQLGLSGVSVSALISTVVLSLANFVGFEGITALSTEAKRPHKDIPRALMLGIFSYFFIVTISIFIQSDAIAAAGSALLHGGSVTGVLTSAAHMPWLATPLDTMAIIVTLTSVPAVLTDASRVIATSAAEGMMPSMLAKRSPRTGAPSAAIVTLIVAAAGIPSIALLISPGSPIQLLMTLGPTLLFLWAVPYGICSGGSVLLLKREGKAFGLQSVIGVVNVVIISFMLIWTLATAADPIAFWSPIICMAVVAALLPAALKAAKAENVELEFMPDAETGSVTA